jgi:hypothetical protein
MFLAAFLPPLAASFLRTQPAETLFVQRDDMIEDLAAATARTPFCQGARTLVRLGFRSVAG